MKTFCTCLLIFDSFFMNGTAVSVLVLVGCKGILRCQIRSQQAWNDKEKRYAHGGYSKYKEMTGAEEYAMQLAG